MDSNELACAEKEKLLVDLVTLRINDLEKLTEERFKSQQEALRIQTQELARRLDALNGEAERLRKMQETYLPREVWETNHKELVCKLDAVEAYKNQSVGQQAIIAGVISVLIALATTIMWIYLKK